MNLAKKIKLFICITNKSDWGGGLKNMFLILLKMLLQIFLNTTFLVGSKTCSSENR
jgi:hypothetical protein